MVSSCRSDLMAEWQLKAFLMNLKRKWCRMRQSGASQIPVWRRSSLCAGGECVEVARLDDMIVMRDSKDPGGQVLRYTTEEFRFLVRGIKAGGYDFSR
jgi:uncharacterized protein DUF397